MDCSYAGPVHRNPSYAQQNTPAPTPAPTLAPVNVDNDLTRVRSKGSSAVALAKFLDAKVPFREKVLPELLCSIIILRILCNLSLVCSNVLLFGRWTYIAGQGLKCNFML